MFLIWVYNIGLGFGYVGFLIFLLFLVIFYWKIGDKICSNIYLVLFIVSLLLVGVYGFVWIFVVNDLLVLDKIGFC